MKLSLTMLALNSMSVWNKGGHGTLHSTQKEIPERESTTGNSQTAIIIRYDLTYKIREGVPKLELPEIWLVFREKKIKGTLIGRVFRNTAGGKNGLRQIKQEGK